MRKIALVIVLCLLFSTWSVSASVTADIHEFAQKSDAVFKLPASLKIIGEEAFEGVSAITIVLPGSTESIGTRAFADNSALRAVYIPESVRYIGNQAFEKSQNVVIRANEDSYAASWARLHDIVCVQEENAETWFTRLGKLMQGSFFLTLSLTCVVPGDQYWQRRKKAVFEVSMRPQDRPELYPINYRFP